MKNNTNINKMEALKKAILDMNSIYIENDNVVVYYHNYVQAEDKIKVNEAVAKAMTAYGLTGVTQEWVAPTVRFVRSGQNRSNAKKLTAESYKGTTKAIFFVRSHSLETDTMREGAYDKEERKTVYLHTQDEAIIVPEKFGNKGKEDNLTHWLCSNISRDTLLFEIDPSVGVVQALNVSEEFYAHKDVEYTPLEKEYAEYAGVTRAIARETLAWVKKSYHIENPKDIVEILMALGLVLEDTHVCPVCGHFVHYKQDTAVDIDDNSGYPVLGHIQNMCPNCFVDLDSEEARSLLALVKYDFARYKKLRWLFKNYALKELKELAE